MPPASPPADPPRDPRLEDRVVELLGTQSGALAFNGLRRSLGVHPESLTRALRRLERYGLVERAASGYRLVPSPSTDPQAPPPPEDPPTWTAVAEVELVPGLGGPQVLGLLAGRWAGSLRWVGVYDRPDEPLLVWSRTDGPGHVLLGIRGGRLRVYADPVSAGAAVTPELNGAARDLLLFALERIRPVTRPETETVLATFAEEAPVAFGPN